jgi:hypothetical protein
MAEKSGDTRYGHRSGSGANEPPRNEKKETAPDWQSRQGGGGTAPDQADQPPSGTDDQAKGKATRGYDEVGTRKHLEGSEQGPS